MTTTLAWLAVLFTLPFLLVWRAAESKGTTVRRLRRQGLTWKQIAAKFNVSTSTARRWATA